MNWQHQNAIFGQMYERIKYHPLHALALLSTAFALAVVPFIPIFIYDLSTTYMEFPPRELYTEKKPFSLLSFLAVSAAGLVFFRILFLHKKIFKFRGIALYTFPFWGWLGLASLIASWVLAWNRFRFFSEWQIHTFPMLWFSYIIFANALLRFRTGRTLFYSGYIMSFVLSVSYWWLFEYLNRFVQNWYYQGLIDLDAEQYFDFASVSFATLLPSVWVTKELVESFFVLPNGKKEILYKIDSKKLLLFASCSFLISLLVMYFLRTYPSELFPLIWLLPLVLFLSFSIFLLHRKKGVLIDALFVSRVFYWCIACLICGFFWEMWNYKSLAKWIYHISYVDTLRIFEMPLLGYLGYLPFGLCCWIPIAFIKFSFFRELDDQNSNDIKV